tara:strand:+ start:5307 stop:6824 length:1518 start_codon:yes stop_codon:yes gene_type:complete
MSGHTFLSWIGQADIDNSKKNEDASISTILNAEKELFDEILLLGNLSSKKASRKDYQDFVKWINKRCSLINSAVFCEIRKNQLSDPTNHKNIKDVIEKELSKRERNEITFNLTSGTPAMHAVMMALGRTKYNAHLLQASEGKKVIPVNINLRFDGDSKELDKISDNRIQKSITVEEEGITFEKISDVSKDSEIMLELIKKASDWAKTDFSVLIEGETGTGKGWFAQAIHKKSRRKNNKFNAINCAGYSETLVDVELFGSVKGAFTEAINKEGLFEASNGGTVFLDEIGNMPVYTQSKLLKFLDNKLVRRVGDHKDVSVDIRIIAATNKDLYREACEGRFMFDLYMRLAAAKLKLPPLRERGAKYIENTSKSFLNGEGFDFVPDYIEKKLNLKALKYIKTLDWPGNYRQLRSTIIRACISVKGDTITGKDIESSLDRYQQSDIEILKKSPPDKIEIQRILDEVTLYYINEAKKKSDNATTQSKMAGFNSPQAMKQREKKAIERLKR